MRDTCSIQWKFEKYDLVDIFFDLLNSQYFLLFVHLLDISAISVDFILFLLRKFKDYENNSLEKKMLILGYLAWLSSIVLVFLV